MPVGQLRIARVNKLAFQASDLIRTLQTKIVLGVESGPEITVEVIAKAEVQGESWRDSEVILPVETPISKTIVGLSLQASGGIAPSGGHSSHHELGQATAAPVSIGILRQLTAKAKIGRIGAKIAGVLQTVSESAFERVLSSNLGHIVNDGISFGGRCHADPLRRAEANAGAPRRRHSPIGSGR